MSERTVSPSRPEVPGRSIPNDVGSVKGSNPRVVGPGSKPGTSRSAEIYERGIARRGVPTNESATSRGSALKPVAHSSKKAVDGIKDTPNWRDLRRSAPEKAREVSNRTRAAGTLHDVGVGVAAGAVGGVAPGGFRGGTSTTHHWSSCDPCGVNCWSSCGTFIGVNAWCGWAWWSWPCYWSWYYPCWWWYSRPYYYADACYYAPVYTSVVYPAETQVVYAEPTAAQPTAEPIGESSVQNVAPEARMGANPLSIAAQRYLELGDRAFREGRYTDAVQFYAKAVEFAPDQGALYLVLADALFAAGDYHYGAYAIRRSLELDPALVETNVDKHTFYPDPGQFDQQLAALERYLSEHPSDRDARLVLALNYLFSGRPQDASHAFEGAESVLATDEAAQKILTRAKTLAGK